MNKTELNQFINVNIMKSQPNTFPIYTWSMLAFIQSIVFKFIHLKMTQNHK